MLSFPFLVDFLTRLPNKDANPYHLKQICHLSQKDNAIIDKIPYLSRCKRIKILNQYLVRAAIHQDFHFLEYAKRNGCDLSKITFFIFYNMDLNRFNSEYYISFTVQNIKRLYNIQSFDELQIFEQDWEGSILKWLCVRKCNRGLLQTLVNLQQLNLNAEVNELRQNILFFLATYISKETIGKNRKIIMIIKYMILHSNINLQHIDANGESFLDVWNRNRYIFVTKPYDFYHVRNLYNLTLRKIIKKNAIYAVLLIYERNPKYLCQDLSKKIISYF